MVAVVYGRARVERGQRLRVGGTCRGGLLVVGVACRRAWDERVVVTGRRARE